MGVRSSPYFIATNGEEDVLLGDLEASTKHGLQVGLVAVLSKAGHLASAGHLHPQNHISSRKA